MIQKQLKQKLLQARDTAISEMLSAQLLYEKIKEELRDTPSSLYTSNERERRFGAFRDYARSNMAWRKAEFDLLQFTSPGIYGVLRDKA